MAAEKYRAILGVRFDGLTAEKNDGILFKCQSGIKTIHPSGEVSEWLKVHDWKSC